MTRYLVMALILVGLLVTGCAGRTSAPPAAKERAVRFFRAWYWQEDYAGAWDMSAPGTFAEYRDKADYLDRKGSGWQTPPSGEIQVKEYDRAGDYLYLVSDRTAQLLVWVTEDSGSWKVRRYQFYEGGDVPW